MPTFNITGDIVGTGPMSEEHVSDVACAVLDALMSQSPMLMGAAVHIDLEDRIISALATVMVEDADGLYARRRLMLDTMLSAATDFEYQADSAERESAVLSPA